MIQKINILIKDCFLFILNVTKYMNLFSSWFQGSEDPIKSPAVATVMPNTANPFIPSPGLEYNNYTNYNNEANTFPSPYNNTESNNFWNQTPPYSNTSGYHSDTSSNFTDSLPSYNQNMNTFNNYNEYHMNTNTSYSNNRYPAGSNGSMYSLSPYESSSIPPSNESSSFNSTLLSQNNSSFNDNSSLFPSNQIPTDASNAFCSNSPSNDLDTTGGIEDMMLNEIPTPHPYEPSKSPSTGNPGNSGEQRGDKGEDCSATSASDAGKETSDPGPDSTTPSKSSGREEPGIPYDWVSYRQTKTSIYYYSLGSLIRPEIPSKIRPIAIPFVPLGR